MSPILSLAISSSDRPSSSILGSVDADLEGEDDFRLDFRGEDIFDLNNLGCVGFDFGMIFDFRRSVRSLEGFINVSRCNRGSRGIYV